MAGLNLIGCRIVHTTGDLRQALDLFERALETLDLLEHPHPPLWNRTVGNLSWVMSRLGTLKRPRAWFSDEYGPVRVFQARVGPNVLTVLDPAAIADPTRPPGGTLGGWWGY